MIRIIGVGNPLRGDDGVGVALAERLARESLPAGVEVLDGGTGGLTLLGLMEGAERVVLVDAADLGRAPGTVVRLDPEALDAGDPGGVPTLHGAGVAAALALGRELGVLPPTVLFLVQVGSVAIGQGLSGPVAEAVDHLARVVTEEIGPPGR